MPNKELSGPQLLKGIPSTGFSDWLELRKLLNDYLKHIATLDAGSIVVIATFLGQFSAQTKDRNYAAIAVIFFVISVVGIIMSELFIVTDAHSGLMKSTDRTLPIPLAVNSRTAEFFLVLGPITFVFGLICLAVFASSNLWQ